jgi:hypothetical protein
MGMKKTEDGRPKSAAGADFLSPQGAAEISSSNEYPEKSHKKTNVVISLRH